MFGYEQIARNNHKSGINCSNSVYNAFKDDLKLSGNAPLPRSIDGKCGVVLSVEAILNEIGKADEIEKFEEAFVNKFGYLKCKDLIMHGRVCNDNVGFGADYLEKIIKDRN